MSRVKILADRNLCVLPLLDWKTRGAGLWPAAHYARDGRGAADRHWRDAVVWTLSPTVRSNPVRSNPPHFDSGRIRFDNG